MFTSSYSTLQLPPSLYYPISLSQYIALLSNDG